MGVGKDMVMGGRKKKEKVRRETRDRGL
ncbi:uncharacterized protein G2W53_026563 [Senna tora]|uniref:Uncharacterized protein n=1 Tax=Senna tora TaxID=362788 RepID=A0A834TFB0_9FABA|nr:uncharacterized protein G2W53_026563 [Senna tora]